MIRDILSKINEPLSSRIKREETVIYILVQIYKILETEGERRKYPILEFFRNWVAHHELDRENARIVLEKYIEKTEELKNRFLTFEVLREDMEKFLVNYNLPQFIVNDGWFQFRNKLVAVIKDQPILKNARYAPSSGDPYLKELCITDSPEIFSRSLISFDLILSDGTNVGGSIWVGDKDEMAKKYDRLNEVSFDYHFNKKALLKIGKMKRGITDKDHLSELNQSYEDLHTQLKRDEEIMANLRTEIANDEFSDKHYR